MQGRNIEEDWGGVQSEDSWEIQPVIGNGVRYIGSINFINFINFTFNQPLYIIQDRVIA